MTAVALALGIDKGYILATCATLLGILITIPLMQMSTPWLWWSSALITMLVAICGLFYAMHCKPLADARRAKTAEVKCR